MVLAVAVRAQRLSARAEPAVDPRADLCAALLRLAGDDVDDPRDGARAIGQARGASQYLDPLDVS
jgi:hypothetical protein